MAKQKRARPFCEPASWRLAAATATAILLCLAGASPGAAQSAVDVSQSFGGRVHATAGVKSPLVRGDLDGDGKVDSVYLVRIGPAAPGQSIADDVHAVKLYDGEPIGPKTSGSALAVLLKDGAGKYLVGDFQPASTKGFFDSPPWSEIRDWAKSGAPVRVAKRGSRDLKGYPCLGKSGGDVLLLQDGASIDEALVWTGGSFKICVDPTNDP